MEELSSARQRYADLIRKRAGLRSERLVRALAEVPRESHVGPGPWKIRRPANFWQYEDTPNGDLVHVYDDVLVARTQPED